MRQFVKGQVLARVTAGDDDLLNKFELVEDGLDGREQGVRDEQNLGASIVEYAEILFRCEQSVERDRNNARLDSAPENGRKVDRVEHDLGDAMLALQPQIRQQVRRTVHPGSQIGVGVAAGIVDDGDLFATALIEMPVDHVHGGIVFALSV